MGERVSRGEGGGGGRGRGERQIEIEGGIENGIDGQDCILHQYEGLEIV